MAILSDITLGQYYPADSFIHKLDPRTKLIATLAILIATIAATAPAEVIGSIVLLAFLIKISKIPYMLILRNLKPFIWLFLLTFLFHCFLTQGGDRLFALPVLGWQVTAAGLKAGILYSVRLAEFVLFAALLTLTTSPMDIMDALDKMSSPLKKFGVPTHEFVLMMTLALRFIPILLEEADRIQKAQMSRGASFDGNILERIKSVIPLLIPLFISVFRRADELALAMDSRCYVGGKNRTSYKILKMTAADFLVLAIVFSYSILLLVK